MLPTITEKHRR